MKERHPEKVNNPINPIKKKPNWIRSKILDTQSYFETKKIVNKKKEGYMKRKNFMREKMGILLEWIKVVL